LLLQWIDSLPPETAELLARIIADWRCSASDDPSGGSRRLIEAVAQIEEWIASRADGPQEAPATVIDPEAISPPDPPFVVASITNTPPPKITDPVGFPMIWIEEIGAFMHWLPVTKIQFEKFIAASSGGFFDDAWYRRLLDLNPRVAVTGIDPQNYCNAFLTGVLPEEARQFAAWCGGEYSLPTFADWQKAYAALASMPIAPGEMPDLLEEAGDLVRAVVTRIASASEAAARPGRERMRADQMLMRLGVLEWVEKTGGSAPWAGMGEPSPYFRTLWSIEKGPTTPSDACSSRSSVFGFRLIRRPA
jgi:hypothetical protein